MAEVVVLPSVVRNAARALHVVEHRRAGKRREDVQLKRVDPVPLQKTQAALDLVNPALPRYKQVRAFRLVEEAFSIESGLLTANGKLKRDLIAERFRDEIEAMYKASQNQISQNQASKDQAAKTA